MLIREQLEPGAQAHKGSLRSSIDELDVSAIARRFGGGGHRQAAGFSSDLRWTRSSSRSAKASSSNVPPRALEPAGVALVDKPRGPSSFAVVAQIRRLTGARTGHAGTLDPFATGLLLLLSGTGN